MLCSPASAILCATIYFSRTIYQLRTFISHRSAPSSDTGALSDTQFSSLFELFAHISISRSSNNKGDSLNLPALGRRSRSHGEVTHGPSPPAKKRCRLAAFAGADQTGMFAPGDPPDPWFGPDGPHFINDECNRGARHLRVR